MGLQEERVKELKAFDGSHAGLKALVDAGISRIPGIIVRPADEVARDFPESETQMEIPVVDLSGSREAVKRAAASMGFFQVVNHGVSVQLLQEMLRKARAFHELPQEVLLVRRDITMEYTEQMRRLGADLFGFLSEALGLKPNHLMDMECAKGQTVLAHYYPPCPQPDLTMGTSKHSDETDQSLITAASLQLITAASLQQQ